MRSAFCVGKDTCQKSVLKTNASESCVMVVLQGELGQSLKVFRVSATSLALKVARSFFSDSLQVMALARAFSSTMLSMVGCRVTAMH